MLSSGHNGNMPATTTQSFLWLLGPFLRSPTEPQCSVPAVLYWSLKLAHTHRLTFSSETLFSQWSVERIWTLMFLRDSWQMNNTVRLFYRSGLQFLRSLTENHSNLWKKKTGAKSQDLLWFSANLLIPVRETPIWSHLLCILKGGN